MLLSVVFFFAAFAGEASAQKKFSRTYPTGSNVRLTLNNRSGTVTVEGWNRPEISISASLEAPAATIVPQSLSGTIVINVLRDNQGKDVGNVDFRVRVPYSAEVDIETRIGNLNVTSIRSSMVRAHISSDGDIVLTNIMSPSVVAENGVGDIVFDGEIQNGGQYRFSSMKGNIHIRIPLNSSFSFVATAPSTRSISLGAFASGDMNFLGDGRRIVGKVGDGAATLKVTNQKGNIGFSLR